ncbi:MAG: hypothetical protein ACYDA6_03695 [Solirubrobacteraceae bacterium]
MRTTHLHSLSTTTVAALALAGLCLAVPGAGTALARHGGAGNHHRHHHSRHSHPRHTGRLEPRNGATGASGPAGPTGATGARGATGPGAEEYVYNSTAPAATEQNTPLGEAGPLMLAGSCVQLGPSLIEVELGATNSALVQLDEVVLREDEGTPLAPSFASSTRNPTPLPSPLLALPASSGGTKESHLTAQLTVTSPGAGTLNVFAYVSEASNVCHMSVVWTPAA